MIACPILLLITTTVGAVGLGDDPKATRRTDEPKPSANAVAERPETPLAEKFDRIEAKYENAQRTYRSLFRGSTFPEVDRAKAAEIKPDYSAVVRQIVDLGATAPKDLAGRDAILWTILKSLGGSDTGPYGGEFALAANWLVRHFGDDPDAVRVGLELDSAPNAYRDHLLLSFYASAKSRESKGLARLALAQSLERKAMMADGARKLEGRPTYTNDDLVRADGTRYSEKQVMPDEEYAYLLHLKQCDVEYLRSEAERLYDEVIAEYGDVA